MVPIISLYNMLTVMMLGIPSLREGIHGLKPAQARYSLQNTVASFYALCWAEPHIHSPHAILPISGRNLYTTSWPTQLLIAVYLKWRTPFFAKEPCCKEVIFFATAVVSHIPHYSLRFMGTSTLTVSSEPSSILGIYWPLPWPKVFLPCLFLVPGFLPFS